MGTIYRNGTAFIGSGGAGGVELTQAEYDALPETEKMNGSIYFISDGETSYPSASTMRYDNSTSGLTATSVQTAVDEVNEKVDDNALDIAELNTGLIQIGKIYRFDVTSGAVAVNGRLPFVKSYAVDNSIYVSGGNAIKFTRSGTVRIDLNVSGQTNNRLWLLIHGNNNHNFITYGTYVTCTSSIVVQVSPSYEFYIVAKEACTINGGGTDPSEIFFTWMN